MSDAPEKRPRIVSELTPGGRGAICVLHVQSPNVVEQIALFFRAASGRPLDQSPKQTPLYGRWYPGGQSGSDNATDLFNNNFTLLSGAIYFQTASKLNHQARYNTLQ